MIWGLPPGRFAVTVIVAKSTCGSEETGSTRKATIPARAIATANSVDATGLLIKTAEMFILSPPEGRAFSVW